MKIKKKKKGQQRQQQASEQQQAAASSSKYQARQQQSSITTTTTTSKHQSRHTPPLPLGRRACEPFEDERDNWALEKALVLVLPAPSVKFMRLGLLFISNTRTAAGRTCQ
jgi:hypothetical protein